MKTTRIYARCEPGLLERIKRVAARLGLSMSAYIRLRLTEAVRRDEGRE